MERLNKKKAGKNKGRMRKALGAVLATALIVNPLGTAGPLFPETEVKAASFPAGFEVPDAIGYPVLNDMFAENSSYYRANRNAYNLAGSMTHVSSNKALVGDKFTLGLLSDVQISGNGTWNSVFDYDLKNTDATGFSQELEVKFGGRVTNYNNSRISLSNGGDVYTCDNNGGTDFATDWMPWDGTSNPQAIVNGKGDAFIEYMYYIVADRFGPGEKGWTYAVEEDGTGKPVIRLSCTDILRPANSNITTSDLNQMKIKLKLLPTDNPAAEYLYCTAQAVAVGNDLHSLEFRILDADWAALEGKNYRIISVEDASANGYFALDGYAYKVSTAVTDYVGNPAEFKTTDLSDERLIIDVQSPSVEKVLLTGKHIDATLDVPEDPTQWPDSINKNSLYAGKGDKLTFTLHLSELIAPLSYEDMNKVALEWNINDPSGNPVVSQLVQVGETLVNGENGEMGSVLTFWAITMGGYNAPQGQQIRPVRILNADLLKDESGNAMADTAGGSYEITIAPDKQNYLDTQGPTATLLQVLNQNVDEATKTAQYTFEIEIKDGEGEHDHTSSGIEANICELALTSYGGAPTIPYEYAINQVADFPTVFDGNSEIKASGNPVYHKFNVVTAGKYYVHVKLSDLDGKELSDAQGLTLKWNLYDEKNNLNSPSCQAKSLNLDFAAPDLVLNAGRVTLERSYDEAAQENVNKATLNASVAASDLNGISRIEYQWVEPMAAVVENAWNIAYSSETVAELPESVVVQGVVTGIEIVNCDVVVRAYDPYGNYTEKRLTMSADLTKAVPQYEEVGNFDMPSVNNDIMIYPPASSSDEETQAGWTRVILDMGNVEGWKYVHVIGPDQSGGVKAMDSSTGNWYMVKMENNTYSEIQEFTGLPTYYGNIQMNIVSSFTDLTPVYEGTVDSEDDTTRSNAITVNMPYSPQTANVHTATLNSVQNSAGVEVEGTLKLDLNFRYYKFDQSLTGARFCFTLGNSKMADWGAKDIDFEKSYAVLIASDETASYAVLEDGTFDESSEVTERTYLSYGTEQTYSVPATDKNGNALETGVYMLKVHIVQKAGTEQDFYFQKKVLLLDASTIPDRFGVLEYEVTAETESSSNVQDSQWVISAAEGTVLSSISTGVAKPDGIDGAETDTRTVVESQGFPAYVLETQNALSFSKGTSASGYVYITAELPEVPKKWFSNEAGTSGVEIGAVSGIKYWNAASTGDPKTLAYYTDTFISSDIPWIEDSVVDGKQYYKLAISADMGWYTDSTSNVVVSKEELAAKDISDFALTLGQNTICYQLQMSNGVESPVYQFNWNLCEEAPTIELSYEAPTWRPVKRVIETGEKTEEIQLMYVPYINVTVEDSFSPNGSVKLFHAKLNENTRTFEYEEIQVGQTVQFTKSSIGYLGSVGTKAVNNVFRVREFICAIDNTGNAVSAYPIQKCSGDGLDIGDYEIIYEIHNDTPADAELFTAKWCAPNAGDFEDTNEVVHRIALNYDSYDDLDDAVEYLMVQLDNGEPVRINTRLNDTVNNDVLKDYNGAGIIGLEEECYLGDYNYKDVIKFVLPYDESKAEGAEIKHTMTVTAYGWSNEAEGLVPMVKTMQFDITGKNIKPVAALADPAFTDRAGEVQFTANTYVKADGNTDYALSFSQLIYESGRYKLHFMDKYGVEYEQIMEIPENVSDPKVTASTTDLTVDPVVITITSENYDIYLSEGVQAALPEGTVVEGNRTKELKLTFKKNTDASGVVVNYTKQVSGADASLLIVVDNIVENAQAINPQVQWSYSTYDVEEGNIVRGNVTATVVDLNGSRLVDPLTDKAPSYVFTPGGETTYTFTGYENEYGVKGADIVAELPVTLLPLENAAQESDVYSPDFSLTGYAIRNEISREIQGAFIKKNDRPAEVVITQVDSTPISKYGAENTFTNLDGFMNKMGWADSYMLRVDVADENAVRLFVKSQLYGEAPDYATGTSDVIEGVTLSGRTLTITQNTQFVLYAVDEKGNSSAVLLEITALGEAPEPMAAQVLSKDGGEVRIFLLPPNIEGVTNLTITNDVNNDKQYDAKLEEDAESIFKGMYYLPVTENGKVAVQYTYEYDGITYTGELQVEVSSIDTEPAVLVADDKGKTIHWSANYDATGMRYTNQQITAQMQFNKPLKNVKLVVAESGEDVTAGVPGLTVIWLENLVTVIYDINIPKLQLTVDAAVNGLQTTIDLPQISTIDIGEPIVSGKVAYSTNHRSAVVTLTTDEPGVLQGSGKASKTVTENGVTKYIFEEEVKENGKLTFTVTDRAGNIGTATVNVTDIVEELRLEISTAGTDATVINPATYEAQLGDTLYVRSNRAAAITMNEKAAGNAEANDWLPVAIGEDVAGLYPCIQATDAYGNTAKVQMLYIPLGDRKAPTIVVKKKMVSASRSDSKTDIDKLLTENITVSDETTTAANLVVDVNYDITNEDSRIPVTYTVTDEAGNQTVGNCILRLYTGNESDVTVNGIEVQWDETIIVEKGKQTITVTADGEPYRFDWKVGIKTAAQLKIGATGLTNGYTTEKEAQYEVELKDTGFYTFLITTQGRNEYRFVLYVEE